MFLLNVKYIAFEYKHNTFANINDIFRNAETLKLNLFISVFKWKFPKTVIRSINGNHEYISWYYCSPTYTIIEGWKCTQFPRISYKHQSKHGI